MSVLMTLKISANPDKLVAVAKSDPARLAGIIAKAKEHGVISHRFWGGQDTVFVVDEWPDEASFHAFFDASPEIPELMAAADAAGEPEISFWTKLDTGDDV
jgi:hypothetical protein